MTLDEAREQVRSGATFGEVAPALDMADRAELAEWYVREPGVPNLAARASPVPTPECEQPLREITGRPKKEGRTTFMSDRTCTVCGGEEFVPGACPTCANCGTSSGGCG